jgi:hypothetical protein
MHKLAIILLSFLVILMPIGTSNNISNVNAISDFDNEVDRKQVSVSPLNCNNINVNVNGFNGATLPTALRGLATDDEAQAFDEDDIGVSSFGNDGDGRPSGSDTDSRFVCINNNNNKIVEGEEEPISPTPPELPEPPEPASLTVKKEIFGCFGSQAPFIFDCSNIEPNSGSWRNCNNILYSNHILCKPLPEDIFDIKVLDDQNDPQTDPSYFQGSPTGKIIENLEPGTYTVEEIKHPMSNINELGEDSEVEGDCIITGFDGGGKLDNSNSNSHIFYKICFEYEDEEGMDCSTISLAAGEEKTCIVKNYMLFAQQFF